VANWLEAFGISPARTKRDGAARDRDALQFALQTRLAQRPDRLAVRARLRRAGAAALAKRSR
jgi:hypothetical protein